MTPNADESNGAANTKTETTKPIMHARRPNSLSSPPHSIVPPAIAIPINPTAYATGPVAYAIGLIGIAIAGGTMLWGGELTEFGRRACMIGLVVSVLVFAAPMLSTAFGVNAAIV